MREPPRRSAREAAAAAVGAEATGAGAGAPAAAGAGGGGGGSLTLEDGEKEEGGEEVGFHGLDRKEIENGDGGGNIQAKFGGCESVGDGDGGG